MADKEYYSFEEVLKDLKLEEDELKRLVSAGEIRAFRDKNTMRFKAEDVDRLRGDEAGGGDLELDDLELELEEDVKPAAPAARAAAPVPAPGLGLDDELTLEETVTEEIELESTAPAAVEADADVVAAAPAKGRTARGGAATARRATRVTVEETEEAREGVGTLAMLIVGALLLLCATFVVLDAVLGRMSNPLSRAVANLF